MDDEDLHDIVYSEDIAGVDSTDDGVYIMYEDSVNSVLTDIRRVNVPVYHSRANEGSYSNDTIIILDNAAEVSIFNNCDLLRGVYQADEAVCVDGVNSDAEGLYISAMGTTDFKHDAYLSEKAVGNLLSFGDCVDKCNRVTYDTRRDIFIIQVDNYRYYEFSRNKKSNLYTCRASEVKERGTRVIAAHTTVKDNMARYSKREVAQATKARDYIRRLGVVTAGNLIKLLAAGKIKNAEITVQDVVRCTEIWGKDLANLKGKTTAKTLKLESEIEAPIMPLIRQDQVLYIDIMYVNRGMYLIGMFMPSEYIAVRKITGTTAKHIAAAVNKMLTFMDQAGFITTFILCDGESAVASDEIKEYIKTHIDTSGGESVKVIERLIRTVKERMRGTINTLPYEMTDILVDWLTQHIVYFMNFVPRQGTSDVRSARERITGKQIDAKKDLKHAFGDYVQIIDSSTNNTMDERSRGGIALLPAGNREGSWIYMTMKTWRKVKRNRVEALPTPDEVIEYINLKAQDERKKRGRKWVANDSIKIGLWRGWNAIGVDIGDIEVDNEYNNDEDLPQGERLFMPNQYVEENYGDDEQGNEDTQDIYEDREIEENFEEELYSGVNNIIEEQFVDSYEEEEAQGEDMMMMDEDIQQLQEQIETENVQEMQDTAQEEQQESTGKYNLRGNRAAPGSWAAPSRKIMWAQFRRTFGLKLSIREAIKKLGIEAVRSVVKEMLQLHNMGTFTGKLMEELTEEEILSIISSSTFLKDKYTAQGLFEKLKARLVGGGHQQDKTIYPNNTSPTATTSSLFIVASIAATEGRAVATVDFPGAFLHSRMPDDEPPVYMRLNKFEAKVLVEIDKSYDKYLRKNGTMIVKLNRALYGCVQSARLWYNKLSKDLESLGFKPNAHDMCVFNRVEADGSQSSMVLHVDDVFISAKNEHAIDNIIKDIESIYSDGVSVHRGKRLDYLGMTMDFKEKGKCRVTMDGYITDLMKFCSDIEGVAKTPASDSLFKIDKDSKVLEKFERERFHTITAKLLYLGKRVRPDILTAIAFLTKRVQQPVQQDMDKLERVIRYIRGTQNLGIILEGSKNLAVYGYIDASYGIHADLKSHTGCVIGIGKGPVFAKSSTQKLNTKSSCEAELVGLSDSTGMIIWTRNFLIEQGYPMGAATVYQDNQSAIKMIGNGKANADRTRHIAIRYFFVKDRVDNKEIKIEYMNTGNMIADILTKPLQGALFVRLRTELLNWH